MIMLGRIVLALALLAGPAWAEGITNPGSSGSSGITAGTTALVCNSGTAGVVFQGSAKAQCDNGFTYAGAGGAIAFTGTLSAPATGSAAATSFNFGTPGTGIFGNSTSIQFSIGNSLQGYWQNGALVIIGNENLANASALIWNGDSSVCRVSAGILELVNGLTCGTHDGSLNYGWRSWGGESRVSSNFPATSNTTLANITGLTATVTAGNTYYFESDLYTTSNVGGGDKVAIAGTATATAITYDCTFIDGGAIVVPTTGAQRSAALATAVGATSLTNAWVKCKGTITVNAGGTLTVQFAQNASNGSASTVLAGSTFIVERF